MSAGESLRFTSVIGAGAVRHEIDLEPRDMSKPGASEAMPGGNAKGWDPYFLLEVGIQYNWGHSCSSCAGSSSSTAPATPRAATTWASPGRHSRTPGAC